MRAFAAAALLYLQAPSCAADAFCDVLKKIAADAPNGFASVRGAADSGKKDSYSNPLLLPGAEGVHYGNSTPAPACEASSKYYSCTFPASAGYETARQQEKALADRIAACLNAPAPDYDFTRSHDTEADPYANLGPAFFAGGLDFHIALMYPPDGGGGTLYLSMQRTPG